MKTLIIITIFLPTFLFAQVDYNLPNWLELVKVDGNLVTVRDSHTGIEDTYLIEGEPVINGWAIEPQQDSLIFELVADLDMYLVANLQSFDFEMDGLIELVGCDLLDGDVLKFLENDGHFNFTEVNRIDTSNILYDLGDGDRDGFIEILTKWDRSIFIYEQTNQHTYSDSLVWSITPLEGNYRVWPRYSDLDDDGFREVSFQNHIDYYKVEVHENTGDNEFDNYYDIPWPRIGPGQFASGDFDGDGHTEVVGGDDYGLLTVFETVISDSFVIVWQDYLDHPNAYMHRTIGDTDADGFIEWVSGSHDFSHGGFFFKVFEAIGDNQYEVIYYDSLPGNPWRLGGVSSGDVDGDGINEFVFSSNDNVGLYKYYQDTGWQRVWLVEDLQGTIIPYMVDTNGDGMCEVIIATSHIPNYTRIYKLVTTEISEHKKNKESLISIYPNPANNIFNIIVENDKYYGGKLFIYNVLGQKIYEKEILHQENIVWDAKDLTGKGVSSGIYFIKVSKGNLDLTRKVTILK